MWKRSGIVPVCLLLIVLAFPACRHKTEKKSVLTLFSALVPDSTGIRFNNLIEEDENVNPLQYENSYNGGGVAIGDLNNDGWDDVYLTSNRNGNKLYLNRGKFQFEDVTDAAAAGGRISWTTGVTMADVNGDGLLDIYICHSGNLPGTMRANELLINQGNDAGGAPRFADKAAEYGLADSAFSNHSAFFDYDLDGDLDMILLNHSPIRFNSLDETVIHQLMNKTDSLTGTKLYRNDDGHFTEVTKEAGIWNARLNFNLGVSVADLNNDGWPDIYISNDYLSPDYLYINQGNGQFKNEINSRLSCTSQFSMGNDVADINNDGWPEIYTLDMLPEDNHRQKTLFGNDNFEFFEMRENSGLHAQYMRNMLHLNNGEGSFSEIAQLAGISNTDWSWAPLFLDADGDGWKDLFVSNGYLRDYTNMDFLKYMGEYLRDQQGNIQKANLLALVKKMPSSDVKNYAFQNMKGFRFSDQSSNWGLDEISNSNGAAYGDLDNDGHPDLVVSNINKPVSVYRNNAKQLNGSHYLRVKLQGEGRNRYAIGARVYLYAGGNIQAQEQLVSRGFQSSVSPTLLFGTGSATSIDSVLVVWKGKKKQVLRDVKTDQEIVLKETEATADWKPSKPLPGIFRQEPVAAVDFLHRENPVNDYKRQPLLINSLSFDGPALFSGDLNGDGRPDLFIGGASGQADGLFFQTPDGRFQVSKQPLFELDAAAETVKIISFDADGNGTPDLLALGGGYDSFQPGDPAFTPRLYLNDGKGRFTKKITAFPPIKDAPGAVVAADLNNDGIQDIFLGGRSVPGAYPSTPRTYLLINDGKGNFSDGTAKYGPDLATAGMFTDAVLTDLDGDGEKELLTVGDWMPPMVWKRQNGKWTDQSNLYIPGEQAGWYNTVVVKDINGDGKPDILAGNYGRNSQWQATAKEPVEIWYKDFDDNGAIDPFFCYYINGKSYPYVGRDELLEHISMLRTRFTDYKSYADADMNQIFTDAERKNALHLEAHNLETSLWLSSSNGKWEKQALPPEAQFAPVYAICVQDFDGDGKDDLLLGGNILHSRIKVGRNQSNTGQLFLGDGKGHFRYLPAVETGLTIKGEVRSFALQGDRLFIGCNNLPVQTWKWKK